LVWVFPDSQRLGVPDVKAHTVPIATLPRHAALRTANSLQAVRIFNRTEPTGLRLHGQYRSSAAYMADVTVAEHHPVKARLQSLQQWQQHTVPCAAVLA
jgi:hypothetical protein